MLTLQAALLDLLKFRFRSDFTKKCTFLLIITDLDESFFGMAVRALTVQCADFSPYIVA
jgi:hypothetical protein